MIQSEDFTLCLREKSLAFASSSAVNLLSEYTWRADKELYLIVDGYNWTRKIYNAKWM